jgi:SNF2 family DNA or RNA helicase
MNGASVEYFNRQKVLLKVDSSRQDIKDRCIRELERRRWRPDLLAFEINLEDLDLLKKMFKGEGIKVDPSVVELYRSMKEKNSKRVALVFSETYYQKLEVRCDERYIEPEIKDVIDSYTNGGRGLKDMEKVDEMIGALEEKGAMLDIEEKVESYLDRFRKIQGSRPDVLAHPLRPYQVVGSMFMALNQRCICADEMGLGKTIEMMATCMWMKQQHEAERAMIIVPASLIYNWRSEIAKFTSENVTVIDGGPKFRKALYRDIKKGLDDSFFFVINYEKIPIDFDHLKDIKWDIIVLDEGTKIKNRKAKMSKAIKKLGKLCDIKFILTGTPLENRLEELFSLMEFVDNTVYGSYGHFKDYHFLMGGYKNKEILGYKNLDQCNKRLHGAMIRRKKDDVVNDLPDKIIKDIEIPLTDYQLQMYKILVKKMKHYIKKKDYMRIGAVFSLLRMLCDDSELVRLSDSELVDDIFKREDIEQHSSKLAVLEEVVDQAMESEQKIVIFTQWVRMAKIIQGKLEDKGYKVLYVDGSMSKKDRQWQVWRLWGSQNPENDYFESDPDDLDDYKILLTTDSLNYGQNLQCASVLVNFEILFNPRKQDQRDARIHRIGADKADTKYIINIITSDTVEERTLAMQKEKNKLFDKVVEDELEPVSHLELIKRVVGER